MSPSHTNNYPKLHNAAWPGVVGKGDGGEPPIDLDTMLDLTAAAEVDGVKFDGFDLFLYLPHIDIDSTIRSDDAIRELADAFNALNPFNGLKSLFYQNTPRAFNAVKFIPDEFICLIKRV